MSDPRTPTVHPGVPVEGIPRRPRAIAGVDTTIAAFVGPTQAAAPADPRQAFTSLVEFERVHGGASGGLLGRRARLPHYVWHAARAFFENGGRRLHVSQVRATGGALPAAADYRAALRALERIAEIAIVAAPGLSARSAQISERDLHARYAALIRHVERSRYRIAILDPPDRHSQADVLALRARLRSSRAALYYPWVTIDHPAAGRPIALPPGGFVAGAYARVDGRRGVHTAPANVALALAAGLERTLTRADLAALNADAVNGLRILRGRVTIRGARTLAAEREWQYVSVRRLLIFLEHSIDRGTQWVAFEPNTEATWTAVRRLVTHFLTRAWRDGALQGRTPREAFFVRCDRTTMTQDDLDHGRLVCVVGVAPVRPAEFVILRIGHTTADEP